ncbi:S8 family peptidase [Cytophagaceae bacterium ABcell3]|nr:S8 family peptidase [Cytophagaceae bacterium ABcell3]
MPPKPTFRHIKIDGYYQVDDYKSPKMGNSPPVKVHTNRRSHGNKLLRHLNIIQQQFEALKGGPLAEGIVQDDAIYVEFVSELNFEPAFNSFESNAAQPKYRLLSIKKEKHGEDIRYRTNVMLTEGGISHFYKKINEYISENVERNGEQTETPKNNKLVSNIEAIKLATLEAFWMEPDKVPFPEKDEIVWWEVWFRKKAGDTAQEADKEKITRQLRSIGAEVASHEINFPEHFVKLVKATAQQLYNSVYLLDNLAELRKPKETADFFQNLNYSERESAVQELLSRVRSHVNEESVAVCILDTGIQRLHPLLKDFLSEDALYSYNYDWGIHDSIGHGTGMAGLVLYGDLTEALAANNSIDIYHCIESYKLINHQIPHKPELYGAVTIEAVNTPVINAPERPRIFCMAVTDKDEALYGRPSSWSAALDSIVFGNEGSDQQLFFVSAGNVHIQKAEDYTDKNVYESVHDPAQAFNAITVGAYTEMDCFDSEEFPGTQLLAPKGGMGASNSSSIIWENDWPIKPEVVMEGGNLLKQDDDIITAHSLRLLTTNNNSLNTPFQTFGDTSGATALASNFAALLKNQYPDLWPETIRGLMVHSADWTPQMLQGRTLKEFSTLPVIEKRNLLRSFGYGVPDLDKALYSAGSSLTLIAERTLKPFRKQGSDIKYDEVHFFEFPWPVDVLQDYLTDADVKLNVTLSYYIEPNPGSRTYSNNFSYRSHGLRFNVIKPGEDKDTFLKRINKNAREEGEKGFTSEDWIIKEQSRNSGSIHRDFWIGSGADLSTRNCIAVYPVSGWYKTRKKLQKYDTAVRYSLIVTIEAPEVDVDIYTPVANTVAITT